MLSFIIYLLVYAIFFIQGLVKSRAIRAVGGLLREGKGLSFFMY